MYLMWSSCTDTQGYDEKQSIENMIEMFSS